MCLKPGGDADDRAKRGRKRPHGDSRNVGTGSRRRSSSASPLEVAVSRISRLRAMLAYIEFIARTHAGGIDRRWRVCGDTRAA